MNRFDRNGLTRFRARDGVLALLVCAALLVVFKGDGLRNQGERMDPGWDRDVVLFFGNPAGEIADALPFADAADDALAFLSPDEKLESGGGFENVAAQAGGELPPVTKDAFEPATIGAAPPQKERLRTLLVTGDSMAQPLDAKLATALSDKGVKVERDVRLGTGISKSFLLDWGELSTQQVKRRTPDAVVVFIGANEGFPIETGAGQEVECCSAEWAALYANRARRMADTYRQAGNARVYWITIPTARDADRAKINRVVNAAVKVAAQPWASQVRILDTVPMFAPRGYEDAITIDGRRRIVRNADGIHLNDEGAGLLAETVLARLGQDFTY
ncbi:GDSL-type esterase/lipase family protein [Solirubrobacter phytolaccae]|uniref:GDSL-type esterase/lipase family protein n=1 Tax=Solirubrobacter phytolaccae TaxID=1404360 RepID=A0A9X3NKZ9_9ACTN|nr:GDSL-type esterase/lipase family protein [Solirubrobacter phytolaccae]MDA0183387.1 GDSL-type esterase/lipase family protein [Solirubrobacter phytolaccae]